MRLISSVLLALLLSNALTKDFFDEIDDAVDLDDVDDAPDEESGMLWTIPQYVEHQRNYFEGFIVGYYHNPQAKVGDECLRGKIEKDYAFIMEQIYEEVTIIHFLDIFKFASKVTLLVESVFEHCGPKMVIEDTRKFCKEDKSRCTWPIVLSNAWWRMAVLII